MSVIKAAKELNVGDVEILLKNEGVTDGEKNEAVFWAADVGEPKDDEKTYEILTLLQHAGASFHWQDENGNTAIVGAAWSLKPKSMDLLLTASPDNEQLSRAVYQAAARGGPGDDALTVDIITTLKNAGGSLDWEDDDGCGAIVAAAGTLKPKAFDLLLTEMARAVYWAAMRGGPGDDAETLATIRKLLDAAGDIKSEIIKFREKKYGRSFLHAAADKGKIQTVVYLVKEGPEMVTAVDIDGMTPLHTVTVGGWKWPGFCSSMEQQWRLIIMEILATPRKFSHREYETRRKGRGCQQGRSLWSLDKERLQTRNM